MAGYIIYQGPSLLNNKPIVVIAITSSKNKKTGNMIQTHILCDNDLTPMQNSYMLNDSSICGDCPQRRGTGGGCYVRIEQGPTVVYKAYKRGIYSKNWNSSIAKNRFVRLGTYGDPAAVPRHVWDELLKESIGHTGYTHQWKNVDISDIVMASCDSAQDKIEADKKGYRTFRVRLETDSIQKNEFICPASEEGGKRRTCAECKACDGGVSRKASPVIITHGVLKGRTNKHNGLVKLDMQPFGFISKLFA